MAKAKKKPAKKTTATKAKKASATKKSPKMKMKAKAKPAAKAKKAAPKKAAKKATATKKPAMKAAPKKMAKATNPEAMATETPTPDTALTSQHKMKISRKKPKDFQEEQSLLSQPENTVNPAARR